MNYQIAIPSYHRPETLKNKTLKVLSKHNINPDRITIFVANQQQYDLYYNTLDKSSYNKIIVGEVGMGAIRRFIQQYYDENCYVMNLDDDLSDILIKEDNRLVPIKNLEQDLILKGFKLLEDNECNLFGIYAVANAFFMKNEVSIGLYYCIGCCFGMINRKSDRFKVTIDDKEDVQRTLQHYVEDGKVVRLDNITVKTKYYKEPGGMQTHLNRTEGTIESSNFLCQTYPDLCSSYIRKSTGYTELRLKDKRKSINSTTLFDFM